MGDKTGGLIQDLRNDGAFRIEGLGLSLRDIDLRRESLLLSSVGARRLETFSLLEDILVDEVVGFIEEFRGVGGTDRVLREVAACCSIFS